jgi:hypothetical protein
MVSAIVEDVTEHFYSLSECGQIGQPDVDAGL